MCQCGALSVDVVIEMIRLEAKRAGGQQALASRLGVHQQEISRAVLGQKLPAKSITKALGLERRVVYLRREK